MSLIAALTDKSWLTPGLGAAQLEPDVEKPWDKGVILSLILIVVTVIFALVTSAYLLRMDHGPHLGQQINDWRPFGEPPLLWINTLVLVASSLAFVVAERSARVGDGRGLRWGVAAGGLLGFVFLAGQLSLWRMLSDWGYVLMFSAGLCKTGDPLFSFPFPPTILGNPALAFFYLITGLHGAHISGGLIAWGMTARHVFAAEAPAASARAVQLCGRYWHFLLLVWAVMMGLFVST